MIRTRVAALLALVAAPAPAQESLWEPGLLSHWGQPERGADESWQAHWERPWGSAFDGPWIDPIPDAQRSGVVERFGREPRRSSPLGEPPPARVRRRPDARGSEADARRGAERAAARSGERGRAAQAERERDRRANRPTYGPADIRRLQRALEARGYEVGPADGVWTPRTTAALRDVQRSLGLPITGSLNPALFRELGLRAEPAATPAADADFAAGWREPMAGAYGYTTGTLWPAGDWEDFVRQGDRQVGGAAGERAFGGAVGSRSFHGAVGSRGSGGAAGGPR